MQKYDLLLVVKFPELICLSSAHMLNPWSDLLLVSPAETGQANSQRGNEMCVFACLHYFVPNSQ